MIESIITILIVFPVFAFAFVLQNNAELLNPIAEKFGYRFHSITIGRDWVIEKIDESEEQNKGDKND